MTRRNCIISTIPAALAFWLACIDCAPAGSQLYASPNGTDNAVCSQAQPCSPQAASKACPQPYGCAVYLADGVYFDPEINVFYYRMANIIGNCGNPGAVRLRATRPGALITIQDHALAFVSCVTLEAEPTAVGVAGLYGRQHVIIDYNNVMCGPLPGGSCITLGEFSIATCTGRNWLTGDFAVYLQLVDFAKLNLACEINVTLPVAFSYFLVASDFTKVNAQPATFSGAGATGIGCVSVPSSIVYKPPQPFPGSQPGNC